MVVIGCYVQKIRGMTATSNIMVADLTRMDYKSSTPAMQLHTYDSLLLAELSYLLFE